MIRLPVSQAGERVPEVLNEVAFGNVRIVLLHDDKAVAALISTADLEWFEDLEDHADLLLMAEVIEKCEAPIPWSHAKAELDLN
jgi:PHD/YefM family antitoxin component YafN of YafNO toxin-antitoxin module